MLLDNLSNYKIIEANHPLDTTPFDFENDNFKIIDVYICKKGMQELGVLTCNLFLPYSAFTINIADSEIRMYINQRRISSVLNYSDSFYIRKIILRNS